MGFHPSDPACSATEPPSAGLWKVPGIWPARKACSAGAACAAHAGRICWCFGVRVPVWRRAAGPACAAGTALAAGTAGPAGSERGVRRGGCGVSVRRRPAGTAGARRGGRCGGAGASQCWGVNFRGGAGSGGRFGGKLCFSAISGCRGIKEGSSSEGKGDGWGVWCWHQEAFRA